MDTIEDYRDRAARLDRTRRHTLLPQELVKATPALYATEDVPLADKRATASYFSIVSAGRWFIVELDPETGDAFGWCAPFGQGGELGYVNIHELGAVERNGLPLVERDKSWTPLPLAEVAARFPELRLPISGAEPGGTQKDAAEPDDQDKHRQAVPGLDL